MIEFNLLDSTEHGDKLYVATAKSGETFAFVAQYWDAETGEFQGTSSNVWMMHGGMKSSKDSALHFSDDQEWENFSRAAGVDERDFRMSFEDMLNAEESTA